MDKIDRQEWDKYFTADPESMIQDIERFQDIEEEFIMDAYASLPNAGSIQDMLLSVEFTNLKMRFANGAESGYDKLRADRQDLIAKYNITVRKCMEDCYRVGGIPSIVTGVADCGVEARLKRKLIIGTGSSPDDL